MLNSLSLNLLMLIQTKRRIMHPWRNHYFFYDEPFFFYDDSEANSQVRSSESSRQIGISHNEKAGAGNYKVI